MKRFSIVNNGYDISEVNRFIDIVIGRLEKLNAENMSYKNEIEKLNSRVLNTNISNHDVEKLEKVISNIQEASYKLKEMANDDAKRIIEEAKSNASSIIHEALINAEKTEQKRILLEKNMKIYKERIKSMAQSQLELVDNFDETIID